ncbi:MAG: cupin-like domain-containing protein [Xanthomonadaceae bacterium]|nr:cupin-like domain-containing protein [Xanthomonadaceae bacterium]
MVELTSVPRPDSIGKREFLHDFKQPAVPAVFKTLTASWPARAHWQPDYLRKVAGDIIVPLYDSQPSRGRKHQHAPAAYLSLSEYLDRLDFGENNLRLFFFNFLSAIPELTKDFEYPDIGLKFFRKLPVLFMGGRGSRVQLHFDIDMADIILAHFGGPKRVILFPPDQTPYLYRVPFSFSALFDAGIDPPNYERYPALKQARGYVADLEHGDALYIPPGYWHYVKYQDIGFSLSLRAFPRTPANLSRMIYNLTVVRSIEGLMRKFVGQPWNDRNERRARVKTHRALGLPL